MSCGITREQSLSINISIAWICDVTIFNSLDVLFHEHSRKKEAAADVLRLHIMTAHTCDSPHDALGVRS